MTELVPPVPVQDAAWVFIDTPLGAAELREFCRDIERLYRINSLLEFQEWRTIAPGVYHMCVNNLSNDRTLATDLHVQETDAGFQITYAQGLKASTLLKIEPVRNGARLIVVDDYGRLTEEERCNRLEEVDHSLVQWGNDLQHYLGLWQRWSRFSPWRWYMRRVWQPMKPSARRVTYMLIWITAAEFVAFLAVFLIFLLEWNRGVL